MDHKEFDELVARLASAASRRDALKGLVGSSLAAVGITTAAEAEAKDKGDKKRGAGGAGTENKGKGGKKRGAGGAGTENKGKGKGKGGDGGGDNDGDGSAGAEACIPTGKKCPAPKPRGRSGKGRRKPKTLSCNQCCQRRTTTGADGKTRCHCADTGTPCTQTRECCDGVCASGRCRRTT